MRIALNSRRLYTFCSQLLYLSHGFELDVTLGRIVAGHTTPTVYSNSLAINDHRRCHRPLLQVKSSSERRMTYCSVNCNCTCRHASSVCKHRNIHRARSTSVSVLQRSTRRISTEKYRPSRKTIRKTKMRSRRSPPLRNPAQKSRLPRASSAQRRPRNAVVSSTSPEYLHS